MFSTGQLIFAILFALVFLVVVIVAYRKDRSLHRKNFKGIKWIVLAFLAFISILFLIKYVLKE
jgi:Mn2+/Fe2+ NRAMP family transporter